MDLGLSFKKISGKISDVHQYYRKTLADPGNPGHLNGMIL
jgi:hypothetical protein